VLKMDVTKHAVSIALASVVLITLAFPAKSCSGADLQAKGAQAVQKSLKAAPKEVALLYHSDPTVRIAAIKSLAASADPALIDDLIRAHSVEYYTPVQNVYGREMPVMTGARRISGKGNWKAWLAAEAKAGRLKIDYIPIDVNSLDSKDQRQIQPFARRLGPENFAQMARTITTGKGDSRRISEAMRYMVANDNMSEVKAFFNGNWLSEHFKRRNIDINIVIYYLNGLADPGPLRDAINTQVRTCLESEHPVVLANVLHLLAGKEGASRGLAVAGVEEKVKKLLDSPNADVALRARRAMQIISPGWGVSFEEAFLDLHATLGRRYPCFELKGIDWKAVGDKFLPRIKNVQGKEEFGLLCMELVGRLEDSHAGMLDGSAKVPAISMPQWDPGFACLEDDRGRPVVYYVDKDSPADKAAVKVGMIVVMMNGEDATRVIEKTMQRQSKYYGYSSERYLRYHAYRFFIRQRERGTIITLKMVDSEGKTHNFELPAMLGVRYLPRLPVPNNGIKDSADVSWKMLDEKLGYIYVRRIRRNLIDLLDKAVSELKDASGLIIDVRGNSGGGFDAKRSHLNFAPDSDTVEPERPRFKGPIALLIDSRCISAGEGWASWFVANNRARVFGEATAGASSRKTIYTLKNGLYRVRFPIKAYRGYLDRPIERQGLVPDVPIKLRATDIAAGRDTVLEAAKQYLLKTP
jgi:C-terminal processing protease CtpA/Prc